MRIFRELGVKLLLVALFVVCLFIMTRVREEVSTLIWEPDPGSPVELRKLNAKSLRKVLDGRGVNYQGAIEKSEYRDRVKNSGELRHGELITALSWVENVPRIQEFQLAEDFEDQVLHTKDRAWLVQIGSIEGKWPHIAAAEWEDLATRLGRFGVRTGRFDCFSNFLKKILCGKKSWTKPAIVLAFPKDNEVENNAIVGTYQGKVDVDGIFTWVSSALRTRLRQITSTEAFYQPWFGFRGSNMEEQIRVIFFSKSENVLPTALLYLSVKYNRRAEIGVVRHDVADELLQLLGFDSNTMYLIITPDTIYKYGTESGDYFSYEALDLYISSLCPTINDVFNVSSYVIAMCALLELIISRGDFGERYRKFLRELVAYVVIFMFFWAPQSEKFQVTAMQTYVRYMNWFYRYVASSGTFAVVRKDMLLRKYTPSILCVRFAFFCAVLEMIQRWQTSGVADSEEESPQEPWWWSRRPVALRPPTPSPTGTPPEPPRDSDPTSTSTLNREEGGMHINIRRTVEVPEGTLRTWSFGQAPPELEPELISITICTICMETFQDEDLVSSLPCSHMYHDSCIKRWILVSGNGCPVCRQYSFPVHYQIHITRAGGAGADAIQ